MSRTTRSASASFLFVLLLASRAWAADTTEGYGKGATDAELYLSIEGVGNKGGRTLAGDVLLGYGVLDAINVYLGAHGSMLDDRTDASSEFYAGIFGTLLDTNHFDLDWMLEIRMGGAGLSELSLIPGIEINLDSKQDMSGFGLYLRTTVPCYNRELTSPDHPQRGHAFDGVHLEVVFGTYTTIASGHQLLLEHDIELRPQDSVAYGLGGLALAYNIMLTDNIELVSQVYVDLPQGREAVSLAFMTGFILAVPQA